MRGEILHVGGPTPPTMKMGEAREGKALSGGGSGASRSGTFGAGWWDRSAYGVGVANPVAYFQDHAILVHEAAPGFIF